METRLRTIEEEVIRLGERVDQVEQSLAALPLPSLSSALPDVQSGQEDGSPGEEMARWATFLGRSCVVLAGAFLIRALTGSGRLPSAFGVALGIAFGGTWIFFAHRAGARGATLSAGFHGVTAALIAYPLVLETTTRLGVMSPGVAALVLTGFTALLLLVSWRDQLGWLAWIGVLSSLITTLILLRVTPASTEFLCVLLLLAAATYWLGDRPRWGGLRWLPALVLDLAILGAILAPTPPVALCLALAGLSFSLVLVRTAALARPVGGFEVFQTLAGLVIGLAGTLRLAVQTGRGSVALAGGVIAASLVALFFAAWVVPRRGNHEPDFLFYSGISLGLLGFGVALVTRGELRGVLWSALALLTALLGRRGHPGSLWWFAALLGVGAAFSSGLMDVREPMGWPAMSPGTATVLGFVVLTYLALVPPLRPALAPLPPWAAPRFNAAVLLFLGCGGLAALVLRAARPFTPDLARLAAARTVVAVVVALSLAWTWRRVSRKELAWIAYLALVLGGLVLVIQGLPGGQPLTLLVSFVFLGAGLIGVPRLAPPGRALFSTSSRPQPSGSAQRLGGDPP